MHHPVTDSALLEQRLIEARNQAIQLFERIEADGLIRPGITELDLNDAIYKLAEEAFGVKKFWHKRIVRAGLNTLCPYKENPPNLVLQENDILFLDFGPIFENFEADLGWTFVLGDDPVKHQLKNDLKACFDEGRAYYLATPSLTGANFYAYIEQLIRRKGWKISTQGHCGHLIGEFPHEVRQGEKEVNYICPGNPTPMRAPDLAGQPRHWILEIHMVHPDDTFGGFYEDLLDL